MKVDVRLNGEAVDSFPVASNIGESLKIVCQKKGLTTITAVDQDGEAITAGMLGHSFRTEGITKMKVFEMRRDHIRSKMTESVRSRALVWQKSKRHD